MNRYIDRDALLKSLPEDLPYKASVKRVLMQAPTANVAPIADTVKQLSKKLINHFDECGAFTDMETDFIALEIDNVAEEFLRGR